MNVCLIYSERCKPAKGMLFRVQLGRHQLCFGCLSQEMAQPTVDIGKVRMENFVHLAQG